MLKYMVSTSLLLSSASLFAGSWFSRTSPETEPASQETQLALVTQSAGDGVTAAPTPDQQIQQLLRSAAAGALNVTTFGNASINQVQETIQQSENLQDALSTMQLLLVQPQETSEPSQNIQQLLTSGSVTIVSDDIKQQLLTGKPVALPAGATIIAVADEIAPATTAHQTYLILEDAIASALEKTSLNKTQYLAIKQLIEQRCLELLTNLETSLARREPQEEIKQKLAIWVRGLRQRLSTTAGKDIANEMVTILSGHINRMIEENAVPDVQPVKKTPTRK